MEALRAFLPAEASVGNPVDMIASASGEDYRRAIETVAMDPDIDAMIVIYIPPQATRAAEIGHAIVEAVNDLDGRIPVATTWMSAKGLPEELQEAGTRIPSFAFPEAAAIAMAHACRYGTWRGRPEGQTPVFHDTDPDAAAAAISEALGRGDEWLAADEVERTLVAFGLPVVRTHRAPTPEGAAEAAATIGGKVALKAFGAGVIHKTDLGAVRLNLSSPGEVESAARQIRERVAASGAQVEGFEVQEMVEGGVEVLVGVVHDPLFGPVVACSAGGTAVELVRDVAVRVTPITDLDATEMVRSLRTFPLLEGFRGAPPADVRALEDVILRLGALVDANPTIAEMDCNPVLVLPRGAVVVDARIRVQAASPEQPLAAR
jgi:acyl-CoA synthetase (NDP forming)